MMTRKNLLLLLPLLTVGFLCQAQDRSENETETEPTLVEAVLAEEEAKEAEVAGLSISGSADVYYKYDFSGTGNIPTSFADAQNSIALGMANIIFSQELDKASFVADLAFGPRSNSSIAAEEFLDENGNVNYAAWFNIQNLYLSYSLTEKLSMTAGFMGTYIGYEVISPSANFNYSTSYLFSNGPFQNAGVKLDYSLTDKVSVMVGLFTDQWDSYLADPEFGMSSFGAQVGISPVDGWDVYLNGFSGKHHTMLDITTGFQVSDPLYVGANVAWADKKTAGQEYVGAAAYLQYALSEGVALGARYEYFDNTDKFDTGDVNWTVNAFTVSANLAAGPITFIPEFRYDLSSTEMFVDGNDTPTTGAAQALIAAVYAF